MTLKGFDVVSRADLQGDTPCKPPLQAGEAVPEPPHPILVPLLLHAGTAQRLRHDDQATTEEEVDTLGPADAGFALEVVLEGGEGLVHVGRRVDALPTGA